METKEKFLTPKQAKDIKIKLEKHIDDILNVIKLEVIQHLEDIIIAYLPAEPTQSVKIKSKSKKTVKK